MIKFLLIFLFATFGANADVDMSRVESGHTHGNAGDPLRMFFREARVIAVDKVKQLKDCDFAQGEDEAKVKMLVGLKDLLAEDIEKSKHVWLSDFQGSCAFTQLDKRNSPIYLSYPECRGIMNDQDKAIELLIHESLHHLGVEEEVEADLLSRMIMDADIQNECPDQPYDPFSDSACEGERIEKSDVLSHFSPGHNSSSIVSSTDSASRYRRCNVLTGCADWQSRTKVFEWFDGTTGNKNADSTLSVGDLKRKFSYRIKTSNPTVFNVNFGLSNFKCELSFQAKHGVFYCNPHFQKKVGRYHHNFFLRDPNTKVNTKLHTASGNSKYTSKFNKSCFWVKNKTIGDKSQNGDYLESEIVFFSKF